MKFGVPWSVKGIRPEARETAKEAARRSGMSLGDWLNTVILQQATQAGLAEQPYGQAPHNREELAGVNQRLDDLTRRIEHFTHTGPAAYAPRRERDESQAAALIGRLDQRLDQFARQPVAPPLAPAMPPQPMMPQPPAMPPRPNVQLPPALDRALAEIAARKCALNGEPAAAPAAPAQARPPVAEQQPLPAAVSAPPRAAVPTQDISGLEQQLRKITDQIETLRKPGVEEAINALRAELGDIGRALDDAMPKRAIDTIERQIAGLSERVAEDRQAGIDAGALAGIEHGLGEVRDALHGLTPAEHLVGFTEAVDGLAQKIDLIVAQKDPATLAQLESAITTLRGMTGSVASNETVSRLAAEVQGLADKVEQIGHGAVGDLLNNLESRIDELSHALAERAQAGDTVPPRLEALVQSLTDKIELIQHTRGGDNVAVNHLEDRIVTLVERLDASDSRLGHLEAIERGLADLLVHIEEMRADKQSARAGEPSPTVDALKQDMARTQDALDAVHGTLGLVVDRLATIEKDIRSERRAPPPAAPAAAPAAESEPFELTQPVGKLAVRLVDDSPAEAPAMPPHQPVPSAPDDASATSALEQALAVSQPALPAYAPATPTPAHMPAASQLVMAEPSPASPQAPPAPQPVAAPAPQPKPQPQPAPAPASQRLPSAAQMPINPDLPPDQPLEPGSGPPPLRAHPAARIAASEAALGGARPASAAASGQSNFIAAARRAAKAAVQQQEAATPLTVEPAESEAHGGLSMSAKMMKRVKSLLVAASIVALVVGAAQLAGHFLPLGHDRATKTARHVKSEPATPPAASKLAATPGNLAASNLLMPTPIGPLPPAAGKTAQRARDPFNSPLALFNPADITGSIPDAARQHHSAPPSPVLRPANPATRAEQLPSAIGGAHLREAALSGNAGAAYEIAVRFAEGRRVPVDPKQAAVWYERAASKGLALAQFRYASMLEKGLGVKKDLGRARRLYLAAAEQGNAKAMHNLAVLYAEGIDGKPDYATAVTWFRKAAQHGVSDSQYNLGILYARGIGVRQDLSKAYKWFALAATRGDKESASKRDDLAGRLDAKQLAVARNAVERFKVEPQPANATTAPTPPGGWDKAKAASAKPHKHPRGPLPLGSFTVGNR